METEVQAVRAQLFGLQDETYRDFQSALMPTVPKEKVIGVRTRPCASWQNSWQAPRRQRCFSAACRTTTMKKTISMPS